MQIVIDIPNILMEYIVKGKDLSDEQNDEMAYAIADGIQLPKGHGDLIDKGIFKKWIETQDGDTIMTEYYLDALDAQETIIEADVERSRNDTD